MDMVWGKYMKISSKACYATQLMLQLGMQVDNKPLSLANLALQQNISPSYLEQLLASLRDAGLVVGVRGPGGGYRIANKLTEITITDILMAVHERHLKRPQQPSYAKSIYNDMWWDLSETIQKFLSEITIADLMDKENIQTYLHEQRLFKNIPQPDIQRKQA